MCDVVDQWKSEYYKYLKNIGADPEKYDLIFESTSNNLIEYWNKMLSGDVARKYSTFEHMLVAYTNWYQKINVDYYDRDRYVKVKTKGQGGRYLP